jgi:hypothetical protein
LQKKFNNESTIVLTSQKTENNDNGEYVTLYRTIGKMHPTLDKQVSDNLLFLFDNPKMNIDMSIIFIKFYCRSNLLEELLGKGLKYTMVKCLQE